MPDESNVRNVTLTGADDAAEAPPPFFVRWWFLAGVAAVGVWAYASLPPIQRRQSNVRLPIFRSSAETTCFSSLGQPEI